VQRYVMKIDPRLHRYEHQAECKRLLNVAYYELSAVLKKHDEAAHPSSFFSFSTTTQICCCWPAGGTH